MTVWWSSWAEPGAARRSSLVGALGAGLLAAALSPVGSRVGAGLVISVYATALPVLRSARGRGRGRVATVLAALGLALLTVPALRASGWLVLVCGVAGLGLLAVVLVDARRWEAIALAVPRVGAAMIEAVPWIRTALPGAPQLADWRPWLRGLGTGAVVLLVVGGLLVSADAAFAEFVSWFRPSLDLGLAPGRLAALGAATALSLGAAFAVSARIARPAGTRPPLPVRHAAEWLIPLLVAAALLALFIAIQAVALFGGAELVLRESGVTYANRARQGFGQLTVVTVLLLCLVSWAGRVAAAGPPSHRRLFGWAAGALIGLTGMLALSALRRLWLYEQQYGWTVLRLNVGFFETWVVVVLLGLSTLWLARREDLAPRLLVGSAGVGLLCLALAGPDAVVAAADVGRYQRTGAIDVQYLSRLSDDAVPALDRLPEPARSCVLIGMQERIGSRGGAGSWPAWNLGRVRAADVWAAHPPGRTVSCP